MTEAALDSPATLDRLKSGDHQAFADLVRRYHRHFLVVARSIIGESLADEIVQEAWVSIFTALPQFEERSSLKSWMYTIVSNEAKSRLRKEARQISLEELDPAGDEYLGGDRFDSSGRWAKPPQQWNAASPESLLEEEELRRCIERTMELLPTTQKAVFLLRDVEQQKLPDICNILNLRDANARVLLHRARLKLMQVIDRYLETGQC